MNNARIGSFAWCTVGDKNFVFIIKKISGMSVHVDKYLNGKFIRTQYYSARDAFSTKNWTHYNGITDSNTNYKKK